MGNVQRGGIIRKNDYGTLERVGKTNTYIGSTTLPDGRVLTKRFRMSGWDEDGIAERWLRWQCRNAEDEIIEEEEADMANEITNEKKNPTCPFSGDECKYTCPLFSSPNGRCSIALGGVGLYNISCNLGLLSSSESIELVAMAIGELGSMAPKAVEEPKEEPVEAHVKTVADGVEAYLADKTFLAFVNLHSKTVYSPYKRFCEEQGYPVETESNFTKLIRGRYPELKANRQAGGCVFVAA